ncbi:MAG TPA: ABC transporter transmembrane domain-containing protein, partial [Bacteroidia bacterium]|nr:ABC transporter transmembrane domain-containing protein [Bacteroidia bacterium]
MSDLLTLNRFFVKYRGRLALGLIFVLLANYFGLLPAQITRKAIDFISTGTHHNYSDSAKTLTFYALGIFGVVFLRGVLLFLMRQTIIVMSRHIEFDMKNEIYDQYQKLDMHFYAHANTGDLMNRISEDVSRVRMYTGPAIMYLVNITVMIIVVFIAMMNISPGLTLVVLFPLPLLVILIYYVQKIINTKSEKVQEALSTLSTNVQESFAGIRIVKSFSKENDFAALFHNQAKNYFTQTMQLARINALFIPAIMLLVGISSVTVIYYGGILVDEKQITYGNIAEFVIYLNMLMWPVGMLGWIITLIQRADASQRRINSFLHTEPEIQCNNTGIVPDKIKSIELNNISFSFGKNNDSALENINLQLSTGKVIAVVGTTGSGKTTIANLMSRLYDPTQGEILVNDIPLKNINLEWWRRQVGFITQDVLLFSDTIANNIAFGIKEYNSETLTEAAKTAMVYEEIVHFKDGFNT